MYCRSGRVPTPVQPRRWLIVSFICTWRFSPLVPLRSRNCKSYSRDETSHMRGEVCYRCRDLSIRPSYRRASQRQSIPQLQDRPTIMWQINICLLNMHSKIVPASFNTTPNQPLTIIRLPPTTLKHTIRVLDDQTLQQRLITIRLIHLKNSAPSTIPL